MMKKVNEVAFYSFKEMKVGCELRFAF